MKKVIPVLIACLIFNFLAGCKTAYFTEETYKPMGPVVSEKAGAVTILFFGRGENGSDGFIRVYHWYAPYSIYITYKPAKYPLESVTINSLSFYTDVYSINFADSFQFPYKMELKEERDGISYNWTPNNVINKGYYPVNLPFSPDLIIKCDIEFEILDSNGNKEIQNHTLHFKAVKSKRLTIVPVR